MNTLELDTMTYHFMVSEVRDPVYRHRFMVSEVHDKSTDYRHHFMVSEEWKIWTFISFEEELIPGFHSGFRCVILDLKDLPSHLFQRIVTFNN